MQAILYCDKQTDCIPVRDCPEALLPLCNLSLIEYLLHYIEQKGFQKAILLAADDRVRHLTETLDFKIPIQYARSLASLHADMPTLLLRRLCVPDWDMGELFSLSRETPVRLFHADSSPTFAELHPQGSVLLEPEATVTTELSYFRQIRTPAEYRTIQQNLLSSSGKLRRNRIGEGTKIPVSAVIDDMTVIGNDCIIGENAKLEGCCLGGGVQIGADTVLKDCVICRKALIDAGMHLENAAVPENTVLYPDSGTAKNRKHLVSQEDGICEGLPKWNTAETALKAGSALTVLSSRIAVGYSHKNSESLAAAAIAGAVAHGASVWSAGECALSQLIYLAGLTDCDILLWIQGEKIMQLRPFNAGGFPLTEQQANRVWQALEADTCRHVPQSGSLHHAESLHALWAESCRKLLSAPEFDITVSCANTALRTMAQELFSGGTGQRITLSLSEDGTKITAFSSESGMLRHEQLLLLSLLSFREQNQPLAVPAEFHLSAEEFAAQYHGKIIRVHDFQDSGAEIYKAQGICTDGIKLFCHVLRVLHEKHLTPSQAAALLPELCTVQHEVSTSLTRQSIAQLCASNPDARISILMPPHSKLVKLRVHADSVETAAELCGFWEKKLRILESEES
ncbi:MAG: hypothetical protein IJ642_02045 [Oscillospiraceae bacterium]|nr:hypothetical protein [Oscillospiraceae bacterium]